MAEAHAVAQGFSWPTRVYWEDTDAGGVVYHGQYVSFLERARTEWMRSLGLGQALMRNSHDLVFAIRDMQLEFLRPARLDDALQVAVELRACRGASLLFEQEVTRDGERLLVAQVRAAALSASTFRPRAIPRPVLDVLDPLQALAPLNAGARDIDGRGYAAVKPNQEPGVDA